MDAKRLLGSERQEHVLGHAVAVGMDAKWLLGKEGRTFYSYCHVAAGAMDAKWLLSRAGKSVVDIGCCVK